MADHNRQRVEVNEQKILSQLWCLLLASEQHQPFQYLQRSSKLWRKMEVQLEKTMELTGTSSVEGLDSLRTLRMVQRINSILTETPV